MFVVVVLLAREKKRVVMDLKGTPVENGYRMPAEWEPHSGCWMGWPVRILYSFDLPIVPQKFFILA